MSSEPLNRAGAKLSRAIALSYDGDDARARAEVREAKQLLAAVREATDD